jgi:outer membrane lipoprotein SlyB
MSHLTDRLCWMSGISQNATSARERLRRQAFGTCRGPTKTCQRRGAVALRHKLEATSTFHSGAEVMNLRWNILGSIAMLGCVVMATEAVAQTRIDYGRITAVRQVDIQNPGAQGAGTLIGGALGVASGSGQSRSNRALRGIGGAAVGSRVAGAAGSSTGFEYTVLIGANTIRITTEQAGLRVGDCVSVERGQFNNIRLAPDERCASAAAAAPGRSEIAEADACDAAKQQLLNASTDEEFDRAERRMRLLCGN